MSAASSAAKGWLLPVVTVAYGYALTQHAAEIAVLGMAAVALFAMLDANYLRQERAYRRLYVAVVKGTRPVPTFTLDPAQADEPLPPDVTPQKRLRVWGALWFPGPKVWLSWSITPFYGGLGLIGVLIALTA